MQAAIYKLQAISYKLQATSYGLQVFDWVGDVFAASVFSDETYYGGTPAPENIGTVMSYNRLVGSIRFRQVRSVPDEGCLRVLLNER